MEMDLSKIMYNLPIEMKIFSIIALVSFMGLVIHFIAIYSNEEE